jgi:arabinan endo-1,5-alpha-L-arabinosidase
MASSAKAVAISVVTLLLWGCQASHDIVARSYGDYNPDPDQPPYVLALDGDLATTDPSMFFWQGTYYVFSSGSGDAGLDLRSSKDLKTFQREPQIFSNNPSWVTDLLQKVTGLWSPCVLAWDGVIHLYYAASWYGASRGCIGHATTTSMATPFVDDSSPIICSNIVDPYDTEPYVAIDPAVSLDDAGEPWMAFGSFGNGINLLALDRQGRRLNPTSNPVVVAARGPDELPAIQAASFYRWRDFYYLFVSHGASPNHMLRVGRADRVTGPYLDRNGKDLAVGGGTVVLKGDKFFTGPGSNMVFDDVDQRLNVYHAYNATGDVVLRIAQLFFDQDGWPISAGP